MNIPESYLELEFALSSLYKQVDGQSFYEYIFPDNEIEGEMNNDYSKPNAIYLYRDKKDEGTGRSLRRRIMLDDTWADDFHNYVEGNEMTLCSGLAYRSRSNKLQHAQRMYALIFDLDGVGDYEIRNLFLRFGRPPAYRTLPMPTFLVSSGTGLHIYYVFEKPIDLYPNIKLQLKALKYDLTFRLWEYKSTSTCQQIQYQSINQGFRMVGSTNSKYGVPVIAYQTGDRVSLDYLNQYAKEQNRVDINRPFQPSKMTRPEAKEAYPDWYERVVVNKQHQQKKWDIAGKVHGQDPYALYHWWLRQIGDIRGGHRYFYMMCLVIYACKCDVPREKLEADLQVVFEQLKTVEHKNPLTQQDIESALETFDREYYNFTISDIEKLTDIRIDRNKRNGRKQSQHMKIMNAIREIEYPDGEWRNKKGRPKGSGTAQDKVQRWQLLHPEGTKADCNRETGLDPKTIRKWWK